MVAQVATLVGWTMVYVFMQMFAIPGTVSLSLLSGALFGTLRGLCLVAGAFIQQQSHRNVGFCTTCMTLACCH